ncbi:MAG: M28 family peptidase [Sphingobacteriales bacterium]|nr:MAG: M28 family peptidase [Sphingobacteriales bacterium]
MHTYKLYILSLLLLALAASAHAQNEKRWLKHQITTLSGNSMHGRGYVNKGGDKAAAYIRRHFKELGLLPFNSDSSYYQKYSFGINTFPGAMALTINKKELKPGADYLVQGASKSYHSDSKVSLTTVNLAKVKDSAGWATVKAKFKPGKSYYLKNADTAAKYLGFSWRTFAQQLPDNLFIIPKAGKLIWTANQDTVAGTVFYVEDSVLPKHPKKALADVEAKYLPSFAAQNVLAYSLGKKQPDSFIVFSAHYDHLGQMGKNTFFPGAHDNASGTAMVMYLASYFSEHPQKYSIAFMLFSGEEAGLLGSKYYVAHPVFPIDHIKFVVNLDMTGDATNGITVVNGEVQEPAFNLLQGINQRKNYLPKIDKREQTKNSDHYSFSQAGAPAVFIYGNGTKGFYHDVFDTAKELSLEHIDGLAKLLIDFTGEMQGHTPKP